MSTQPPRSPRTKISSNLPAAKHCSFTSASEWASESKSASQSGPLSVSSRFKHTFARAFVFAFAISSILLTACASLETTNDPEKTAATQRETSDELFSALDTNHDGFVSKEEMKRALDMFSEEGRMESTQMVYGLKSAKATPTDKLKHLSATQKKRLIARAFEKKNSKAAADDQERLTQEDFRKIVIGPQTSNDSRGDDDAPELEPNPWQKLL